MKQVVVFITHKTLELEHCRLCLESLSQQSLHSQFKFDTFYIYNTHQDEISNELIYQYFEKYNLGRFFESVDEIPYDTERSLKCLGQDVLNIRSFLNSKYDTYDRALLLKSDILLSTNYFQDISDLPQDRSIYFVAPFICAKKRIPNSVILNYISRKHYVKSDDITFFVEDQFQSTHNDFYERTDGKSVTDESILFTSCYVIRDWTCHYFTLEVLDKLEPRLQSWGGVGLQNIVPYFVGTDRSFVVHKYHGIISENRENDREGPVREWLDS